MYQLSFDDVQILQRLEAAIEKMRDSEFDWSQEIARAEERRALVLSGHYQVSPVDIIPAIRAAGAGICHTVKYLYRPPGKLHS